MDKKHLVWEIIKIAREHRKTIEKRIGTLGIHPSQHHFLMYISKNGSCTQSNIAEAMEVSAATVAVSLKKLERGGYITKESSPGDGRSNQIVLTSKGEAVVEQSRLMFETVDEKMFQSMTEEEQQRLHCYMERIIENLKAMEEKE